MTQPVLSRREWLALGTAATALAVAPAVVAAEPRRIRLSLNENGLGPAPGVAIAIRAAAVGVERYVEQAEVDRLAAQIARLERVSPDQVVIGEVLEPLGLYLARRRIGAGGATGGGGGGGGIVFSAPGYTALVDAAAPLGGRPVPVPLNAALENDLPALGRAIGPDTLAVSLVNPHNPSGTVGDADALHAFIRQASDRTLVVVDEAYLEYDDLPARSAIRHVRAGRDVLVFRTLAKIYGLAGLSIGYAVAPAGLARGLREAGIGAPHSLSRVSLAAAGAALADQSHVATVRAAVARERIRLNGVLDDLGLRHSDSHANFVFFVAPDQARARAAFAAAGIEVARPFPPLDDWIRISIGRPADTDAVIAILRRVVPRSR